MILPDSGNVLLEGLGFWVLGGGRIIVRGRVQQPSSSGTTTAHARELLAL